MSAFARSVVGAGAVICSSGGSYLGGFVVFDGALWKRGSNRISALAGNLRRRAYRALQTGDDLLGGELR